jgi:hypothetical protein
MSAEDFRQPGPDHEVDASESIARSESSRRTILTSEDHVILAKTLAIAYMGFAVLTGTVIGIAEATGLAQSEGPIAHHSTVIHHEPKK